MFLQLAHTKLDAFNFSKAFVLECYRVTKNFPSDEKFAMTSQIRCAALSTHLNIAEGCSRKSLFERKCYYEIARGFIIEVDTAFDIALSLNYCSNEELTVMGETLIKTFKLLSGMINGSNEAHY